jgi:hypothetical protein
MDDPDQDRAAAEQPKTTRGYAVLAALYAASGASLAVALRGRGVRRLARLGLADQILLGVATHKLSRIVTRAGVLRFARAPFTEPVARGAGEQVERPKPAAGPVRRAVGELLSCPYCAGPWSALALGGLLALRPAAGRAVARLLTAVTIADFLHQGYAAARDAS